MNLQRFALSILGVVSFGFAQSGAGLSLDKIKLPPGFRMSVFATGVDNAREMALSPNGTLFVGSMDAGNVYAVSGGKTTRIASGLRMPTGVAFRDRALYIAEVNRVSKLENIESRLASPSSPVTVYDRLPSDRHHGWKFIAFGPDGLLYVPVGAPCNVCQVNDPYGTITRMKSDGSGFEIFARGIRNSVGFDWNPVTKELWFTDNGRDNLGDNIPPDELNHAPRAGMNFGFPKCHAHGIKDPEFGRDADCSGITAPAQDLGPHVAAIGMRFYTGSMFPPEYRNQIFIAEHGSWNRSVPLGYRVMLARLEGSKVVKYEPFAEGWLQNGRAWGRPADVLTMPDGSLLVSDDQAGVIYRITYTK